MLVINIKDGESIDRALRRYKKKVRDTKLINEIRERKNFEKPSVSRRKEIIKAVYKNKKQNNDN